MLAIEEAIPRLHQLFFVLTYDLLDAGKILRSEPLGSRKRNRIEPELRNASITPDVYVRGFSPLVGVGEQPVGPDDLDRW
jgi:hypothetical protein